MYRSWSTLMMGLIVALVTPALVQGMPPGMGRGPRGPKGMMKWGYLALKDDLKLSEDQVERLKSIERRCRKETIKVHSKLQLKRLELEELLDQPKVDREKVDALVEEMGRLRTKLILNLMHAELDARGVLNKEQLKRARELLPEPWFMGWPGMMMRWVPGEMQGEQMGPGL